MIKAAFFDIDGTLVSLKKKVYPPSVPILLKALRKKGILCFVATGRSRCEIDSEHLLDGLVFDGYLTNNGQDAYAPDGRLLYSKALEPSECAAVLSWVEEHNVACWMVSSDAIICNQHNDRLLEAMVAIHTQPPRIGDLRPMLEKPIYKIVLFLTREEMAAPLALAPSCKMTQWFPLGHDLIPRDGGKKNALLSLLKDYDISPEECIAFGDSENDMEMLQAVGIGVAMGNATPECKAIADYITSDCDEDGILSALRHYNVL